MRIENASETEAVLFAIRLEGALIEFSGVPPSEGTDLVLPPCSVELVHMRAPGDGPDIDALGKVLGGEEGTTRVQLQLEAGAERRVVLGEP